MKKAGCTVVRFEPPKHQTDAFIFGTISILFLAVVIIGYMRFQVSPVEEIARAETTEGVVKRVSKRKTRFSLEVESGEKLTMEHMGYFRLEFPALWDLKGKRIEYAYFSRGSSHIVVELNSDEGRIYSKEDYLKGANEERYFWFPLVSTVLGITWVLCFLDWKFNKCVVIFGKKLDFFEPKIK